MGNIEAMQTAEIVILIVAASLILAALATFGLPKCHWRPWHRHHHKPVPPPGRRGAGISLLVPFRSDGAERQAAWNWLRDYWQHELPGAELIIDTSEQFPFCKTEAVNRAARRARGDVFVILDADCYIPGDVIEDCANAIRRARNNGRRLWFIPYRRFYRLTQVATDILIDSEPEHPYRFPSPPPKSDYISVNNNSVSTGHWWGALIQIMPREAFKAAGGMDERFAGWGGEDVSFMMAVDTLWAKHKTTGNDVFHLWHPSLTDDENPFLRMWKGQSSTHSNDSLEWRYHSASGDRAEMKRLIDFNRLSQWVREL